MGTETTGAHTRMMRIVHGALRRDLDRVQAVLTSAPRPGTRQARALGEHVVWLTEFLHDHHTGEDEGLWPLVRARAPDAAALLDSLDADHRRITPAAEAAAAAASRYAASAADTARCELLASLAALTDVLLPHPEREVEEAMPVVAAHLTQGEWLAWDRKYNVAPKSFRQQGREGHWLLDGIDPEGYRAVVGLVPAVPRFVLVHGFARSYRRRVAAWWRPPVAARRGADR